MRRDLERLIEQLAALGVDLTLTTNGSLLPQKAQALADAGLTRVTVSLDALDDATFRALNDVDFPVDRVLEGIEAAHDAGLPVKVNAVVKRGANEDQIVPMAAFFRERGHTLRFIEYMDVGHTNGWRLDDVVPAAEIVATLDRAFGVEPVDAAYRGEVAKRYRYRDGSRRVRRHLVRHPAVLRRLHPRPPVGGRPLVHMPFRRPWPRSAGRDPERSDRRRARRGRSRISGMSAKTAIPSSAPRRPPIWSGSRCPTSAARIRLWDQWSHQSGGVICRVVGRISAASY